MTEPWGLVFSGHMIDRVGRPDPRFPPAAEPAVARAVADAVAVLAARHGRVAPVLAGAACGGDILFHEAGRRLGLVTEVVLALPAEEFRVASVAFAGADWERRYDEVLTGGPVHVIEPPDGGNPFDAANRQMLTMAEERSEGFTVMVLWDGAGGDGEGGTADMVRRAVAAGGEVVRIDPGALAGVTR